MSGMHRPRIRGVTYTERMKRESRARGRMRNVGCHVFILQAVLIVAGLIAILIIV